ncbi:unnamed protein product [Fraxinus pennsylvanica]|uniref:Uncharacterized protein n=1 Tax=Fraxinus pennsylvanica TaxID=56036 RepID=A0AAD1ZHS9_9LAMI|nr:unnamed protein product [Fraxinus pennsylvanica]
MLDTVKCLIGAAGPSGFCSKSTADQVTSHCPELHSITAIIIDLNSTKAGWQALRGRLAMMRGERKSDFENSEDERRTRLGSLKKKALNGSSKFKHSLKKKSSRRKSDIRGSSVSIEDIQGASCKLLRHFGKPLCWMSCCHTIFIRGSSVSIEDIRGNALVPHFFPSFESATI